MFNNREIATGIWLTVFLIWMLSQSEIRKAVVNVVRAFLQWKIVFCVVATVLYTTTAIAILFVLGLWRNDMVKDAVLWFGFTGFAMVVRFATSAKNERIVRTVLIDNLKLVILIEFLIGTYVFSLGIELILVLVLVLLTTIDAFVKTKNEHSPISNATTTILAIAGLVIVSFSISQALADYQNLGTIDTGRTILFPPIMAIIFIPFIFGLVILVAYENIFVRLACGREKATPVMRYAKSQIFRHCGLSIRRLHELAKWRPMDLLRIETRSDVDDLLQSL